MGRCGDSSSSGKWQEAAMAEDDKSSVGGGSTVVGVRTLRARRPSPAPCPPVPPAPMAVKREVRQHCGATCQRTDAQK